MKRELSLLIKSLKIHARVALVFGWESLMFRNFADLMNLLGDATSLLYRAEKENWTKEKKTIMEKFEKEIDPLRSLINIDLVKSAKVKSVFIDLIKMPD